MGHDPIKTRHDDCTHVLRVRYPTWSTPVVPPVQTQGVMLPCSRSAPLDDERGSKRAATKVPRWHVKWVAWTFPFPCYYSITVVISSLFHMPNLGFGAEETQLGRPPDSASAFLFGECQSAQGATRASRPVLR